MGDESIIYGKRHGETIRSILPGSDAPPEEWTDWPLAVEVLHAGKAPEVYLHIIQFDQETGYRQEQNPLAVVTLSRDGCNRMIRALQEHRNKAYGADA
jgi:hypothetical protein